MESEKVDHTPHRSLDSGTFIGHIVFGSYYILFGLVWMYNTLFRYHAARRQAVLRGSDSKKLGYKNMLFSRYHSGWGHAVPAEGIVVVAMAISGIIGEFFTYHKGMPVMPTMHHLFLYFSSGILGLTEILRHYNFAMPPSSEYAMFIVSTAAFSFLFSGHNSGHEIVNRQMHLMLVYFSATTILCTALELMHKRNVTIGLGRIIVMMSQGIWMFLTGFIAYPLSFMPAYDLHDHGLLEVVKFLGVVDIGVALVVAFTMNAVIAVRVRTMNLSTVNRIVALTHYQRVPSGSKGEDGCPLISDSDYEI